MTSLKLFALTALGAGLAWFANFSAPLFWMGIGVAVVGLVLLPAPIFGYTGFFLYEWFDDSGNGGSSVLVGEDADRDEGADGGGDGGGGD